VQNTSVQDMICLMTEAAAVTLQQPPTAADIDRPSGRILGVGIESRRSIQDCCCDFHVCMTFGASDNAKPVNILALYSDMQAHHSGLLTVTSR
jgi:hypothetical protein